MQFRRSPGFISLLLFCIAALIVAGCSNANKTTVTVRFVVSVPDQLGEDQTLYLCGNLDQLGAWNGKGLALKSETNGTYTGTTVLPRGQTLEYKITRGSWDTVEKSANGQDINNRRLVLDQDQTVPVAVAGWPSESAPPKQSTATGDLRYHKLFHSKILGNDRTLTVWLPPGYEADKSARYPVLYMHDGQNLFDDATSFAGEWHADETAAELIAQKKIVPIIIVGIENAGAARVDEYTPTRKAVNDNSTTKPYIAPTQPVVMEGGNGAAYARFVVEEVKPFIDATYRTQPDREHTAVAGSSLGGLISLYMGWKYEDVFGMIGGVSPSLWWDHQKMLLAFESDNRWMRREKIWFDMGSEERSGLDPTQDIRNTRELHAIMLRAGMKMNKDFVYKEFEGARHNELAWSQRFDQILLFFFGK